MTVAPDAPTDILEPWIQGRLRAIETYDPAAATILSDYDLNPEAYIRADGPLQHAAVLAALVERDAGLTVILTRRADSLKRHSGQVAFPGGRAEPGERPWETALREAEEEIGLDRRFVRVAGLGDTYETMSGFSIIPVVGFVSPGFTLSPHDGEVAEVFETPFAFLMDPANHELHEREFSDGRRAHYYAMPHEERLIWGATAGMLRGLYERLFGGRGD